jgi:hypothetical protein
MPDRPRGLLDHLVGDGQHHRRDCESECVRRFGVDHQFELGRLLDWQVRGLSATEYSIDITRRTSPNIMGVGAVGKQTACDRVTPNGLYAATKISEPRRQGSATFYAEGLNAAGGALRYFDACALRAAISPSVRSVIVPILLLR